MVGVDEPQTLFAVVVPLRGESAFLPRALNSILAQEGANFRCNVHVQDGSADSAAETVLKKIGSDVDGSRFVLTYEHRSDSGVPNAVNRGLGKIAGEMLTWLGADDILMPGALQTVSELWARYPRVQWVTGLPQVLSESGLPVPANFASLDFYRSPQGFSREALRRGFHATGLNHGFIQQEGTFWTRQLWDKVGGLNEDLRFAFDFDLWTRLADHSELVEVIAPLGAFRVRRGQISEDRKAYEREMMEIRLRRQEVTPLLPSRITERTVIALINKETLQWRLSRSYFLVVPRNFRVARPKFLSGRRLLFRFADLLRKISPTRFWPRVLLVLLGKVRKMLS